MLFDWPTGINPSRRMPFPPQSILKGRGCLFRILQSFVRQPLVSDFIQVFSDHSLFWTTKSDTANFQSLCFMGRIALECIDDSEVCRGIIAAALHFVGSTHEE